MKNLIIAKVATALLLCTGLAQAQTLMGSAASMEKQYQLARSYGFNFVNSSSELQRNVNSSQLVRVNPDRYMDLHAVSYPYAVSETKLFLGRLSAQYYSACGEKLVVTSLLRPRNRQPANASVRSVHPTGMAVDLRIPAKQKCRSWLENTLLSLEKERVLDVTRERYPPHYHVAVYAKQYETRVASIYGSNFGQPVTELRSQPEHEVTAVTTTTTTASRPATRIATQGSYIVRKGDSLSKIADRTGVSVPQLRLANGLRGNLINAGQKLRIPTAGNVASAASKNDVVAANEFTHRVNRGDTLWTIANRYGTSVKQLRRVNSKTSDSLQVGQVLKISRG